MRDYATVRVLAKAYERDQIHRNRRHAYLPKLEREGYFEDSQMKERQPGLFMEYVGKYEEMETRPPKKQRKEIVGHEISEEDSRDRAADRNFLVSLLKLSFLNGEDEEWISYDSIDNDESLDDWKTYDRDQESDDFERGYYWDDEGPVNIDDRSFFYSSAGVTHSPASALRLEREGRSLAVYFGGSSAVCRFGSRSSEDVVSMLGQWLDGAKYCINSSNLVYQSGLKERSFTATWRGQLTISGRCLKHTLHDRDVIFSRVTSQIKSPVPSLKEMCALFLLNHRDGRSAQEIVDTVPGDLVDYMLEANLCEFCGKHGFSKTCWSQECGVFRMTLKEGEDFVAEMYMRWGALIEALEREIRKWSH